MKILSLHNRKDTSQKLAELEYSTVTKRFRDIKFFCDVIINCKRDLTFYPKGIAAKFCK